MTSVYLDSSALAKRYMPEVGTGWIRTLTDPAAHNTILLSDMTRVEVAAALSARYRGGTLTLAERDAAITLLVQHVTRQYQMIPPTTATLDRALLLTQQHRLRGYDAVQLATALLVYTRYVIAGLPPLVFIAADTDLVTAASAEGLTIDNPQDHP